MPWHPFPLNFRLQIDSVMPCHEQDLGQDIGEFGSEAHLQLLRRVPFVSGLPGSATSDLVNRS
ncbi:hypothetical protein CA984_20740 [Streptosporangium minutum]|uniref:Uncharacterized protein n=1 Tax=Streptosporangium minutum TaxID=569862 RepID=A0A243RJ12_9ACTN|nr:hypothetical protein CA984_20740 [Streptosporangium minutum]